MALDPALRDRILASVDAGFAEQIAFIISGNGADEASNLVRRAAGLQPAMAL